MKIGYLTNFMDSKNGGGRYASDLIFGMEKMGYQTLILKSKDDGFDGYPVIKNKFFYLQSLLKIKKLIADCDLIHALDAYPFGVLAWLTGKRYLITAQGTYSIAPLHHWQSRWLVKQAYQKAETVIAISSYIKTELAKEVKISSQAVINHGVDLIKFKQQPESSSEKYILSVGAIKRRKGYHISIRAFAAAKKKIPDLKYYIVGAKDDEEYFNFLKKIIEKEQLDSSVIFLENLSDKDLLSYYRRAKLFILTSINDNFHLEGFGLAFLEAAASGLPGIGTFATGIEDSLKNGYNGFLVPQNDIGKTADAILTILTDVKLYERMSEASREWASRHSLGKMIKEYHDLYQRILSKN